MPGSSGGGDGLVLSQGAKGFGTKVVEADVWDDEGDDEDEGEEDLDGGQVGRFLGVDLG